MVEALCRSRPIPHLRGPRSAVLGTSVKRLDGPDKVTGRANYTFDITRPGMLYGRIVALAVSACASVRGGSGGGAACARASRRSLVHRDPADANNQVMFQGDESPAWRPTPNSMPSTRRVRSRCEYDVLPHVTVVEQALAGTAPQVFTGGNVRQGQTQNAGDLAAGFDAAAHRSKEPIHTQVITHVCLESHGTVCEWDGDKLTAWISTQGINGARENFASGIGHAASERPRLRQYMGGGFGSKALASARKDCFARRLAKAANAPVKLMLDRKEEHLDTGNRPSAAAQIKAGVSADGMITAFDAETWGTGGAGAARVPAAVHLPDRRIAVARTRTSSPTPASSARCARRAIRRARSRPRS